MKNKIYRYVVQYDGGSAPRPFGGVCSLAICKPNIRRTATKGDWIIGFRSRQNDQVVYVMQVNEILPFAQYWNDPRFEDRRPSEYCVPPPDNIYCPSDSGKLNQVENPVHDENHVENDLSGLNVLLGHRFWYFGSSSPVLPDNLKHLKPYHRGHSVHINRRSGDVDIQDLEDWLESHPCGVHGLPIDASEKLKVWLSNTQEATKESLLTKIDAAGCSTLKGSVGYQSARPKKSCN